MCEVFPYIPVYFFIIPLRLGLLFISIQSMMTGAFGLALMGLLTEINFLKIKGFIKSLAASDMEEILSQLGMLVNTGYTLICFVFMLMGVLLFVSTLSENDDLIHTYVWGTFINAMFGLAVTIALFINCLSQDSCLLSSVDWFSAAIIFFILILAIMFWVYNSCITHSYLEYKKKSN